MKEKVILLGSEGCGAGDAEIGYSLLMNFLEALPDREDTPAAIVMWNSAVKLILKDSPAVSHLKKIEEKGVKVLACKNCIDEFSSEDQVAVGKLTNLGEIISILFNKDNEVISL